MLIRRKNKPRRLEYNKTLLYSCWLKRAEEKEKHKSVKKMLLMTIP